MAGHTYFSIGTSGKLQGRIYWESTSNGPAANTSTVYAYVQAARTDAYGPTTGDWTGDINIADNARTFNKHLSINDGWVTLQEQTITVRHNDDGTGTAFVGGTVHGPSGTSLSGQTVTGFQYVTLDTIPRGTSITGFTVSKRNETSLTFNWSTANTIDYAWYSTDNGANWTGVDVTDGTSGSFNVGNLSPNKTYNCKIKVRRKDSQVETISGQVQQTTYAAPSEWLAGRTETSLTIGWSIDSTANHIWYSVNNGSWVDVGNVNATSGTYTISGLSQNTGYNIKTLVRRSGVNTQYETSTNWYATYAYPYCTSAPDFTIGNSVTLQFYNPLNRTIQIQLWSHVSQAFVTDAISCSGTSYTFTPTASRLYASIPNDPNSKYNVDVWYGSNKNVKEGGKYYINNNACIPTFSDFAYKDVATSDLITAIDDDQVLVQNVSNVNVVISSANKMVAKNSASPSKYQAVFSNLSKTITYSDSDIDTNLGTPTGSGNVTFKVTAYDTRNSAKEVSKEINIIAYKVPTINATIQRVNNFENDTKLNINGTYTRITIDSTDRNLIKTVRYRYKETGASTWGAWTNATLQFNTSGTYSINEITLSLDNSKQFDFEFETTDRAKTVTATGRVGIGQPLMFLHSDTGDLDVQRNVNAGGTTISKVNIRPQSVIGNDYSGGDGWYKVCESTMSGYGNTNVLWLVKNNYASGYTGILNLEMRSNNGSIECWNLQWVARRGIDSNHARIVISGNTWTLYFYRHTTQYGRISFHELYSNSITGATNYYQITYYNSTTKESTEPTATVTSSDGFTVQYANSSSTATNATNATNATYAANDQNGNNLVQYYAKAYTPEGTNQSFNDVGTSGKLRRSGLYSYHAESDWWDLINVRHRNGEADGTSYGMQIITRLTSSTGGLLFRKQYNGNNWTAWENLYRVKNLYNNTSGTTGTVTLSETCANFSFLEIFYQDTSSDVSYHSMKIYSPNGGKRANLIIMSKSSLNTTGTAKTRLNSKTVSINTTSITVASHEVNFAPSGDQYNANEIKIVRVDGYR